ncbi:MAG: TolC family protein [Planctomycetales bacterium]|nr:TolC family protein [Planctomycetales bacterium]
MSRIFLVCLLAALSGCTPTQPFFLHEDGDLSHYIEKATTAAAPDLAQPPLPEVEESLTPLTLSNPEPKEMWDLSLQEVISISLANSKVIRGGQQAARLFNGQITAGTGEGQFLFGNSGTVGIQTIFNPAIVSSNPGQNLGTQANPAPFGDGGTANIRSGPEAALAEFDTQLSLVGTGPNGALLASTDRPQNIPVNVPNVGFIKNIQTRTGGLTFQASKQSADGTTFTFRNSNSHDSGFTRGSQFQALKSFWTSTMEVEARHPLLRGRGVQINRMPVVLGRIGEDIEIMALNAQLQDHLNNTEVRYWDLYLAYRNLETAKLGRDGSLVLWRVQYERFDKGSATAQEEAEAREQYFNFKGQIAQALRNLYDTENELRFLMGLGPSDGRLIRPSDQPTMARVNFDWTDSIAEAVARRPELIGKRWQIKQRELEVIWARNFLLPQLDVGGLYRWVGLGENLINAQRSGLDFPAKGSTAYDNLFGGNFQEFGVFASGSMSVGFRRELAGVRHAQLRLAREKAFLEDMELDVATGLAKAYRNIDANYVLVQDNANRLMAARRDLEGREALRREGTGTAAETVRVVLDSQRRLTLAENAFWSAVAEYNKSIADFHNRKGSILEYNGIQFEEGPWPQKAYWDALQRARERDAGHYVNYGWTRPAVVSRGDIPQGGVSGEVLEGAAVPPEEVQTPTPAQPKKAPANLDSKEAAPMEPMPSESTLPAEPPMVPEKPEAKGDGTSLRAPMMLESSSSALRSSRRTSPTAAEPSPVRQVQHMEPIGSGVRR